MSRFSWIILLLLFSNGTWSADQEQMLLAAVSQGREQSVQNLLVQGVDANTKNPAGRPVLVVAAFKGDRKSVV